MNIFREPDTFNNAETAAIRRLKQSHAQLPDDAKSPDGLQACSSFLEDLASAAHIHGVQPVPRNYRADFTPNYRAIFPDNTRNYRVDVLEGCLDQPTGIYVNGDRFELSAETISCSDTLHTAWADLGAILERWEPANLRPRTPRSASNTSLADVPRRSEMSQAFHAFDTAWANLEHKYISELIEIEGKARQLVVEAISQEKKLCALEAQGLQLSRDVHEQAQRDLVQSVARINSVANHRRKGRDDLGLDILLAAQRVQSQQASRRSVSSTAAQILAADVLQSFEAVRQYLRQVEKCLECVDPHLCNNPGLVARLVDWEESWEVGQRYLTSERLLQTLCDFVSCMQRLQAAEPKLTAMCEDCDVGLFLALPRLLLLRYLAAPEQQTDLLQGLLPHRFRTLAAGSRQAVPDEELSVLVEQFARAKLALSGGGSSRPASVGLVVDIDDRPEFGNTSADAAAWLIFARAAVADNLDGGAAAPVVKEFMRELERWSVEVQRHCPEDWNQCSAVMVQCLSKHIPRKPYKFMMGAFDV
jgi:hypothetical protein